MRHLPEEERTLVERVLTNGPYPTETPYYLDRVIEHVHAVAAAHRGRVNSLLFPESVAERSGKITAALNIAHRFAMIARDEVTRQGDPSERKMWARDAYNDAWQILDEDGRKSLNQQ